MVRELLGGGKQESSLLRCTEYIDSALVLEETRHEVWLPGLSDQKSQFGSMYRKDKSFSPDVRKVICKKIYLTYCSASTAVRTVANLEQALLLRSLPVVTSCAWSCSWSVVFHRSSCVCVLGLSTLILVLSTVESCDFDCTMYKEVCPSWL